MKKIYGCFLLIFGLTIPVGCFVRSSCSEHSRTWFCEDNGMYITIVDKPSDYDLIILDKSDTILVADLAGTSLYGIELHLKVNSDTVHITCDYLSISEIRSHKYHIIPIVRNKNKGFTIPIMYKSDDIIVCGDIDSWNFYVFKYGKSSGMLEVVD